MQNQEEQLPWSEVSGSRICELKGGEKELIETSQPRPSRERVGVLGRGGHHLICVGDPAATCF